MKVIHRGLVDSERSFTYTDNVTNNQAQSLKKMSQSQYLKMLEREIQRVNRKIDLKILEGRNYVKEAREHKLLLKKVRYHSRRNFFSRFFPTIFNSRFQF